MTTSFNQLVSESLKEHDAALTHSQLQFLNEAILIYDPTFTNLIPRFPMNDLYVAQQIGGFLRWYLIDKIDLVTLAGDTGPRIDSSNLYKSIVIISIISTYGSHLYNYEIYDHFYHPPDLRTVDSQESFLFTVLLPVHLSTTLLSCDGFITIDDIVVTKKIYLSVNPGVTRFLKEKFGIWYLLQWKKYLIEQRKILYPGRNITKIRFEELQSIIEVEEAKKYTPGTMEYKQLADNHALKTGQLSAEANILDYAELIALVKMYLDDASITQLLKITQEFKDRLDIEGTVEDQAKEDLIKVLNDLLHLLPKLELCRIIDLLGKEVTIPLSITNLPACLIVYRQVIKDPQPFIGYDWMNEFQNNYPVTGDLRTLISEKTERKIYSNQIINETNSEIKNNLKEVILPQALAVIQGTVTITIYSEKWIYRVILMAGDIVMYQPGTPTISRIELSNDIYAYWATLSED